MPPGFRIGYNLARELRMAKPLEHWCRNCGGRIETQTGHPGPAECPYCGAEAPLRDAEPGRQSHPRKRAVWLSIAVVVVLLLVVFGYAYRRFLLSGLDIVAEATGGRKSALLSLALALLALAWILVWMLLPFLVYFGLRDLRRRTAELDRTTRLCAHHLARASAERDSSKIQPAPRQDAPRNC